MTPDEHRARHKLLHEELDELLADYLGMNRGKVPSRMTVMELLKWSHRQTIEPQTEPTGNLMDVTKPAIRPQTDVQRAHDILRAIVTGEVPVIPFGDPSGFVHGSLDVLCWVLAHDHNPAFGENLSRIEAQMKSFGFRLCRCLTHEAGECDGTGPACVIQRDV